MCNSAFQLESSHSKDGAALEIDSDLESFESEATFFIHSAPTMVLRRCHTIWLLQLKLTGVCLPARRILSGVNAAGFVLVGTNTDRTIIWFPQTTIRSPEQLDRWVTRRPEWHRVCFSSPSKWQREWQITCLKDQMIPDDSKEKEKANSWLPAACILYRKLAQTLTSCKIWLCFIWMLNQHYNVHTVSSDTGASQTIYGSGRSEICLFFSVI